MIQTVRTFQRFAQFAEFVVVNEVERQIQCTQCGHERQVPGPFTVVQGGVAEAQGGDSAAFVERHNQVLADAIAQQCVAVEIQLAKRLLGGFEYMTELAYTYRSL